ncbi:uncharacterized protein [Cherax quadricarinatus]|uniref:uncharacterized protein isoform X2 n=1 Tax=Cherax quadricarinatus TaxID=27406 RepID=UPI00387EC336
MNVTPQESWNHTVNNSTNSTAYDYGLPVVVPLSFFLVVSMVLAFVGNVMVILTIVRHRGMRTRTNLLLANLAVADILVAVLDMPIALVTIIKGDWIFSTSFCYFNGFTVGLGLMLSVHTLVCISIHKFISITRPFSTCMTPRKIVMMIVAAWVWTILFNLTPTPLIGLTNTTYKKGASQCGPLPPKQPKQFVHSAINTACNLVIPMIVMCYCYYRIFKEVKDHLSRMRDFADASVRNSIIQQKRITETLCIVLSIFVLFWTPYIVYSLSVVFLGIERVREIFNPIVYLFGYMNSACNPIIYALRSPSFRRGFSEIICRDEGAMSGRIQYKPVPTNRYFGGVMMSFRRSLWRSYKRDEKLHGTKTKECQQSRKYKPQKTGVTPEKSEEKKISVIPNPVGLQQGISKSCISKEQEQIINCSLGCENIQYNSVTLRELDCDPPIADNIVSNEQRERHPTNVAHDSSVDLESNHDNLNEAERDTNNEKVLNLEVTGLPVQSSSVNLLITNKSDTSCNRQRRASVTAPECQQVVDTCTPSSSHHNFTALLPSSGLKSSDRRLSKSHWDVIFIPTDMRDIKSASAGDVRSHQPIHMLEKRLCSSVNPLQHSKVKNAQWPLVWQPSVDNLSGSPLVSKKRQIFHVRITREKPKFDEQSDQGNTEFHAKPRVGSLGNGAHLRLAALINNVKRSFSDLFNLEESYNLPNDPSIENTCINDSVELNAFIGSLNN